METENDKKLSAEQSLEIIREAIEQSRKSMTRSCARTLLMWGVLVCVTSTAIGFLWSISNSHYWNLLWVVMAAVGLYSNKKMYSKDNMRKEPKTFVNDVIKYIWQAFAATSFIAVFIGICAKFDSQPQVYTLPITATINICICLSAMITALVLKNKTISTCVCIGAYGSITAALEHNGPAEMTAMFMAGLIMMVLPGTIILYRMKKAKSHINGQSGNEKEQ